MYNRENIDPRYLGLHVHHRSVRMLKTLHKVEHQSPHDKRQSLDILVWKREDITMDFITKLPWTAHGVYSIRFIVDQLTERAHFIPI